jgi:small subunit ribosomal protein S8
MNRLTAASLSSLIQAMNTPRVTVIIPHTKFMQEILKIFLEYNLILAYEIILDVKSVIRIKAYKVSLCYPNFAPVSFKFVSTPGNRIYCNLSELRTLINRSNYEVLILSTNKGCLTGIDALKIKSGGELLLGMSVQPTRKFSKVYYAHNQN